MTNHRIIVSACIITVLFALPAIARSYGLIDLANDVNITATDQNGQCSSVNIGNIVDSFNKQYAKDSIKRAEQAYINSFKNHWQQWVMCIIGSTIFSGSGVSGAKSCTSDVASQVQAETEYQFMKEKEDSLITDCTAQSNIRDTLNSSRRILLENGRDGGAVYVRNWRSFQADNRYRGLAIARNQMANTNHCPWVAQDLQANFRYNPAQAAQPQSGNEDGRHSYINDAACTFQEGFNPFLSVNQTGDVYAALSLPQNNIIGSYLLAQDEVRRQMADEEQAGENAFVPTGGMGPLYEQNPATGDGCAVRNAEGTCLEDANIDNPAAGVVAEYSAQRQALYDLVTNPRTETQVAVDVQKNLVSSFLSLNQPLAQLQYKRGGPLGTPTPGPTPPPTNVPGSGDVDDPVCTGGNPDCHCAINNTSEQELARGAVLTATRTAMAQHPEMLTPDGNSVLGGQNVQFLQAVCQVGNLSPSGGCRPNNTGFGLVLALEPIEINVDVILPTNVIRQPGVVTLVCTSPGNM